MSSTPTGSPWSQPDDDERTEVLDVRPAAPETGYERTAVLDVGAAEYPEWEATRPASGGQPTFVTAPQLARVASTPPEYAPPRTPAPDVARPDPRGTDAWLLQLSRMSNRPTTDVGLLLLRLWSVPLVLHGVHHVTHFGALVDTLRPLPLAATAPEVFAVLVVAGQLFLPALLVVGLLTRMAGLAQAGLMATVYALAVLTTTPVLDPATGVLSGENALAYAAFAAVLVFTGPGRFSLDHLIGAERREARAERRLAKRAASR